MALALALNESWKKQVPNGSPKQYWEIASAVKQLYGSKAFMMWPDWASRRNLLHIFCAISWISGSYRSIPCREKNLLMALLRIRWVFTF